MHPRIFLSLLLTTVATDARAEVKLNYAWSIDATPSAAVDAALATLRKKAIRQPELIVTYFTEQYAPADVAHRIHAAYPKAKVFGQTVYKAVFTTDGLHLGPNGSIAMMAFEGKELTAGVAGVEIPDGADAKAAVEGITKEAMAKAGKPGKGPAPVIFVATKKGTEEQALAGVNAALAGDALLSGGTPTTNTFAVGAVIANDKAYAQGAAVAMVRTTAKAGASFVYGFVGEKKSGKVTEAKGRNLRAIDGRPAQTVYKEWAAGRFDHLKPVKEDIVTMETAIAPLAKKVNLKDGQERLITVRPQKFRPDDTLIVGADVAVGDTLYLVEGTKEALVKRAGVVAKKSLVDGKIKLDEIAGGVHIYCAGASTVIGLDKDGSANEMIREIAKSMNGRPFIGGFTSAEQGSIPGFGYFNGNLMSSMVVFGK